MTPSSELAMISEIPPIRFTGYNAFKAKISEQREILQRNFKGQYLSFDHVSQDQFKNICRHREDVGSGLIFTYYPEISTLIVKIPTRPHEIACVNLGQVVGYKARGMNLALNEFCGIGTTTHTGGCDSKKEGDSAWTNPRVRPEEDSWPFLVIEAGVSESLPRLKADAKWWIESSAGDVKIVIIIHIHVAAKFIEIQKYTPEAASRHLGSGDHWVARKTWETLIDCSVTPPSIPHQPLILEFLEVFGRVPQTPKEQDVVLSSQDLAEWAEMVFTGRR